MNGLGVGATVGLGAVIGLAIVAPGTQMIEFMATAGFYGFVSGMIFHAYQWALTSDRPFRGRR